METIFDAFKIVKQNHFLNEYAEPKPDSGINHRIAGIGTHKTHTKTELRESDKISFRAGLKKLAGELLKISESPDEVLFKKEAKP
jgi:hypothetical protein